MNWQVDQIIHFETEKHRDGLAHLGFHDTQGNQYALSYDDHWVACLEADGRPRWTAGSEYVEGSQLHIDCELRYPSYVTDTRDGSVLITSSGNKRVYRLIPEEKLASILIDGETWGLKDMGNCESDGQGNLWINEITGCKVWQFDPNGQPRRAIGNGIPGFQREETPFNLARKNAYSRLAIAESSRFRISSSALTSHFLSS
jgi:hypothetical protein